MSVQVFVRNLQKKVPVDRVYIKKQAQNIMKIIKLEKWEVNVNLIGDRKIAKLNEQLLKKKGRTDIISVCAQELKPGKKLKPVDGVWYELGDIYLGMGYIRDYCTKYKRDIHTHIPRLLVHGVCHLLGYDHIKDSDYKKMLAKENYIWRRMKVLNEREGLKPKLPQKTESDPEPTQAPSEPSKPAQ